MAIEQQPSEWQDFGLFVPAKGYERTTQTLIQTATQAPILALTPNPKKLTPILSSTPKGSGHTTAEWQRLHWIDSSMYRGPYTAPVPLLCG